MNEMRMEASSTPPDHPLSQDLINYLEKDQYSSHIKRAVDIFISSLVLLISSPLLLLIALGIKLHSPGPVFYRQKRVGKNGEPFEMLKFRSMQVDANAELHKEYVQSLISQNLSPEVIGKKNLKIQADPRVTGLGRILRSFGLDELPQFFNVLRGEMSIVGPRPPMPYEYELYSNWHKTRLSVLPGITGLWQVTAHNQVPFERMVEIDLDYILTMSLWNDIKIILMTPIEMLRRKG